MCTRWTGSYTDKWNKSKSLQHPTLIYHNNTVVPQDTVLLNARWISFQCWLNIQFWTFFFRELMAEGTIVITYT